MEELRPIKEAKNRAYALLDGLEAQLALGEITEEDWYREVAAIITPAYLAGDDPRAQSGSSGDDHNWELARRPLEEAIEHDGTFLDVGCASGYLMECLHRWLNERGIRIECYGLDIAPELADLARRRLPHWAERIYVGNAIDWIPPFRFNYVRVGLEYVPIRRRHDLIQHLLDNMLVPGGRLIIGITGEEAPDIRTAPTEEEQAVAWGFAVSGHVERPHPRDPRLVRRAFWIDVPNP